MDDSINEVHTGVSESELGDENGGTNIENSPMENSSKSQANTTFSKKLMPPSK